MNTCNFASQNKPATLIAMRNTLKLKETIGCSTITKMPSSIFNLFPLIFRLQWSISTACTKILEMEMLGRMKIWLNYLLMTRFPVLKNLQNLLTFKHSLVGITRISLWLVSSSPGELHTHYSSIQILFFFSEKSHDRLMW